MRKILALFLVILSVPVFATEFLLFVNPPAHTPLNPEHGIRTTGTNATSIVMTGSDVGGVLDVTDYKDLTALIIPALPLTHLKANGLSLLTTLDLTGCLSLTDIDLSGCSTYATAIDLSFTWTLSTVTNLNIAGCSITTVHIANNPISVMNLAGYEGILDELSCSTTLLTNLNLNGFAVITTVSAPSIAPLTSFSATGAVMLSSLDLNSCPNLTDINLSGCSTYATPIDLNFTWALTTVTNLDVSDCPSLTTVACYNNPIVGLNLSGDESTLQSLDIAGLSFTNLNVDNFTALTTLGANNAVSLISVSATNCPMLVTLALSGCSSLADIDLSGCSTYTTAIDLNGTWSLTTVTNLNVSDCVLLPSLDVDVNPVALLNVTNCPLLVALSATNGVLPVDQVNKILTDLDAAGAVSGTCDLTGDSNDIPSVVGLTAKTNLEVKGWTVNVNSNTPESAFVFDGDGTITSFIGAQKNVIVPPAIGGVAVTNIAGTAFRLTSVTNVVIPDGVLRVQGNAFGQCSSLQTVTLPSSLIGLIDYAFTSCTSLTGVYFNSDAPTILGGSSGHVFLSASAGAIVYYRVGASGWTDPWESRVSTTY